MRASSIFPYNVKLLAAVHNSRKAGAMKTADSATENVHQKQVVVSIILYHKLYGYQ